MFNTCLWVFPATIVRWPCVRPVGQMGRLQEPPLPGVVCLSQRELRKRPEPLRKRPEQGHHHRQLPGFLHLPSRQRSMLSLFLSLQHIWLKHTHKVVFCSLNLFKSTVSFCSKPPGSCSVLVWWHVRHRAPRSYPLLWETKQIRWHLWFSHAAEDFKLTEAGY